MKQILPVSLDYSE